jgi:hypothetical protein
MNPWKTFHDYLLSLDPQADDDQREDEDRLVNLEAKPGQIDPGPYKMPEE